MLEIKSKFLIDGNNIPYMKEQKDKNFVKKRGSLYSFIYNISWSIYVINE